MNFFLNNITNNEDIKILIYSVSALAIIVLIMLFFQMFRIITHRKRYKNQAWNSIVTNIVESNQNNPKNINKIMNHKTNWDYEYSGLKKIHNLEIKSGKHIKIVNEPVEKIQKIKEVKNLKHETIKLFKQYQNESIFDSASPETTGSSRKNKKHRSAKEENFAQELLNLEESIKNLKSNNKLPKKEQSKVKKLIKDE